jgi:transcriptional regulator with XRE-family HTH domain
MTPQEFGKLLCALRQEHLDEETRKPLTQAGLAKRARMTRLAVGKIERGETARVAPADLFELATALKLTSLERRAFFFATVGLQHGAVARPHTRGEQALEALLEHLRQIRQPAFIADAYSDVVAANRAAVRLLELPPSLLLEAADRVDGFNILRVVFDPRLGYQTLVRGQWERIALSNVHFFRAASLTYRATEEYELLWCALMKGLPRFEEFWVRSRYDDEDHFRDGLVYRYTSPTQGPVAYSSTTFTALSGDGELHFVTYNAMSEPTERLFHRLMAEDGTHVYRMAPWPTKRWREIAANVK